MLSRSKIETLLSDQPVRTDEHGQHKAFASARPAAVLMVLANGRNGFEIMLTKRAEHLRLHAGQVSLPGGKPEPADLSPAMTALREAEEETGLRADHVDIGGYLPPVLTNTNYLVDLAVGFSTDNSEKLASCLQPAPQEVEAVWFAALHPLIDLRAYERVDLVREGRRRQYWQIKSSQPVIWGATAAMLRQLAVRLAD